MNTTEFEEQAAGDPGLFDLDVTVIESGDDSGTLIGVTDDNCGSTCASPCATNVA
ncbi:FxLD family lanthipeptide [Yinghuangia sp. ASG 101]|uniref:FxLD family lanthipeptide n=1 Tax=Yinghuangia sp. ASG 101 TaxID=2896848 RepID=UPI001E58A018|nr:FxLD family lanthipeptide [Yinghuangia sp. ASG 101]UGQ13568.1 FxLD family lanthipeptide [Yinghuangia sp. ASG 101]